MWGTVHPRWNLLKFHLFNFGPGPMSARDLANQLVNRSSRPGEDFKEKVCPYATQARWNAWRRAKHEVESLCRHRRHYNSLLNKLSLTMPCGSLDVIANKLDAPTGCHKRGIFPRLTVRQREGEEKIAYQGPKPVHNHYTGTLSSNCGAIWLSRWTESRGCDFTGE